jgi:hypothetical protein
MSARLRLARQLLAELRAVKAGPAFMCEGLVPDLPLADDDAATWPTSTTRAASTPATHRAAPGLETGAEHMAREEATGRKGMKAAS